MASIQNSITDIQTIGIGITIGLIIFSIAWLIMIVATCSAIVKMKDAINDIADVYCKINKEKYREIKKQEEAIEENK